MSRRMTMLVPVLVAAFAIANTGSQTSELWAIDGCDADRCNEITCYRYYYDQNGQTIAESHRYETDDDSGGDGGQALDVRTDGAVMGGTVTEHDWYTILRIPGPVADDADCRSSDPSWIVLEKLYQVSGNCTGGGTPVSELRNFCADSLGLGVSPSWHEGAAHDEE